MTFEREAQADGRGETEMQMAVRRFHLRGIGGQTADDLEPAILRTALEARPLARHYPLAISDGPSGREVAPLAEVLERALERAGAAGVPLEILGRSVEVIVRATGQRLEREATGGAALGAVLDEVLDGLASRLDLSPAATGALAGEVERLRPHLPRSGVVVHLGPGTALALYTDALRAFRAPEKRRLREEVERLIERLDEILLLDDGRGAQGRAAERVAAHLGAGGAFIDPASLAGRLPAQSGSRRLSNARRARIAGARAVLLAWLATSADEPELFVVTDGSPPEGGADCRVVQDANACAAAIRLFDRLAESVLETLRALRTARLEVACAYEPERHDEALATLAWPAFADEDLLLMPAVALLADSDRLGQVSLDTWSLLLRSGRPVQVLVEERGIELREGLGAVALALREALVLQSSLASPRHLAEGLERMAAARGPALAIVAAPVWDGPAAPWTQLVAYEAGRATPCFRYEPAAGETWAERFDLSGNPQPDRLWPLYSVPGGDGEATRVESFTLAHAAALDPRRRPHFGVVRDEGTADDLLEVREWLDASADERMRRMPFIWIASAGSTARAVITRELAFACRDRSRAYRTLQELGGLHNEHARRAAAAAREQAQGEAREELEALEARHAEELERVRDTAAREAVDRLVAVLLEAGTGAMPVAPLAKPVPAPATGTTPPAAASAPVASEVLPVEEPEVSFDDPYIDSVLCTTCNECTQLNPRLFAYNGNRQAYVADAAAGTFEQLVRAAEKCPARCIHPGAPRAGDATATAEWISRARPFNR